MQRIQTDVDNAIVNKLYYLAKNCYGFVSYICFGNLGRGDAKQCYKES